MYSTWLIKQPINVNQRANNLTVVKNNMRVSVTSLGGARAIDLVDALKLAGAQICDHFADLNVFVACDYLQAELEAINYDAIRSKQPWMLTKLVGSVVWLGPIFEPPQTACWLCLAQRLQINRQIESYLGRVSSTTLSQNSPCTDLFLNVGANLAAAQITRWQSGECGILTDYVLTYDPISSEVRHHRLLRRPQCRACGEDRHRLGRPKPIELERSLKQVRCDWVQRSVSHEETLRRYQHHVSPITGIVTELTRSRDNVEGVNHIYRAGHSFTLTSDDVITLHKNVRGRSGGKGFSDLQSMVSAMSEAIERYCGVFRGEEEITVKASYRDLEPAAIHPQSCLLFSETQYKERRTWNSRQTHNKFHAIAEPLDESVVIDWTPLWSMTHSEFKYLPSSYCYYGHPDLTRFSFCGADSNGCAAGNFVEEAIVQGFLELVERDSVAIWWYNRINRPQVNVQSFDVGSYYRSLKTLYDSLHRSLWVIDITSDLDVPAFAAISGRMNGPTEDIILGYGAHFDPETALVRALMELNQSLPLFRTSSDTNETVYRVEDSDMISWFTTATMANQSYLMPSDSICTKTKIDYRQRSLGNLAEHVEQCLSVTGKAGLEFLCLQQTRPDIGMPVCKVVVPGLRHFWRRLGPGRLYDVPVKLGWLTKQRQENELNPVSMFF